MGNAIEAFSNFKVVNFLIHNWLILPDDSVGHDSNRVTRRDQPMKLKVPPSLIFKMVNALNGAAHRGVECTWNALPLEDLH